MDIPPPPADTDLRNIIDKLAQFVARNGPEFEAMTKQKQRGNSKFQFLYGGEHFRYYQYKVASEQALLRGNPGAPPIDQSGTIVVGGSGGPPPSWEPPPDYAGQIEALQEQIKQSEANLAAQHAVLLQGQQSAIDVVVAECELKSNQKEAEEANISLLDFNAILQPIIDNCTKDSIQTGKGWILANATNKQKALCISHCLLTKVLHDSTFSHRLHVIYLVNDVLHHCARKQTIDVKEALESVVVPMFCAANLSADSDEQRNKLDKLLQLWESKANYLDSRTVRAMHSVQESMQTFKANQLLKYSNEIARVTAQNNASFENYRAQHQAFVMHVGQQIQDLEEKLAAVQATNPPPLAINPSIPPPAFNQPPPGFGVIPALPDFSKPPPNFSQQQPPTVSVPAQVQPTIPPPPLEDLIPTVPYYELPAGLMVPLIKLEDTKYVPLDPKLIRLPPPAPPNDRLIAAVEAFYALPSHERPRDSEGWEKLGLYEYYKAKNIARKEKEEMIARGLREASRTPSPIIMPVEKEASPPRRRYTSKSPPPSSTSSTPNSSSSRHRHRSSNRSHSRSPPPSVSPPSVHHTPRRGNKNRSGSRRQRSRSRSHSPPPYVPPLAAEVAPTSLDSSNKGHQMLKRMGWAGSGGLGLNEQGIDAPISGGDVRDRQDQFKGVGCSLNDPFENFRKNKGAAFITRMKARAEERAIEKQPPSASASGAQVVDDY